MKQKTIEEREREKKKNGGRVCVSIATTFRKGFSKLHFIVLLFDYI